MDELSSTTHLRELKSSITFLLSVSHPCVKVTIFLAAYSTVFNGVDPLAESKWHESFS